MTHVHLHRFFLFSCCCLHCRRTNPSVSLLSRLPPSHRRGAAASVRTLVQNASLSLNPSRLTVNWGGFCWSRVFLPNWGFEFVADRVLWNWELWQQLVNSIASKLYSELVSYFLNFWLIACCFGVVLVLICFLMLLSASSRHHHLCRTFLPQSMRANPQAREPTRRPTSQAIYRVGCVFQPVKCVRCGLVRLVTCMLHVGLNGLGQPALPSLVWSLSLLDGLQ